MAATATTSASGAALLAALRQHPNATAVELADHASIGRSTAGKTLVKLAADGRVIREHGGRQNGRVIPDRWTLAPDEPDQPTTAITAAVDPDPAAQQEDPKGPPIPPTTTPRGAPGGVPADQTANDDQPRRDDASPAAQASDTSPTDPAAPTTLEAQRTGDNASASRLGHGELRALVRGYLAERPGEVFTPHQIAKALRPPRSPGAVGNALVTLSLNGEVAQTDTKPRRYMIAPQPSDTSASAKAS